MEETVIDELSAKGDTCHIERVDELQGLPACSFNVICNFADTAPSLHLFKESYRLLAPCGVLCTIAGSSNKRYALPNKRQDNQLRKELLGCGFQDICVYGLSPSLDDIRLAVPLGNNRLAAASLALYQPSLKRAKLRKLAAYVTGLYGLSSLWTPFRLFVTKKGGTKTSDGFSGFISELYSTGVELALFTGTPGYLQKPTLQIMNASGVIIGYGKICKNLQTSELIENEFQILEMLSKLDLGSAHVPEVKYFGNVNPGGKLLIQSCSKKPLSSGPLIPKPAHLDFLVRLFDQTRMEPHFIQSACLSDVLTRLRGLNGGVPHEWCRLLQKALEQAAHEIEKGKVSLSLAHRDFTPWNTFFCKGHLFIFDWEFARMHWPPLTDAFHFIIQKQLLVDKQGPESLLGRLLSETSMEGRFLYNLSSRLEIEKNLISPLLIFYLCDIAILYWSKCPRHGRIEREGVRLFACWEQMLGSLLSLGI